MRSSALAESVPRAWTSSSARWSHGKVSTSTGASWPAPARLASRVSKARLAKTWNEHTATGAPPAARSSGLGAGRGEGQAALLSPTEADALLSKTASWDRRSDRLGRCSPGTFLGWRCAWNPRTTCFPTRTAPRSSPDAAPPDALRLLTRVRRRHPAAPLQPPHREGVRRLDQALHLLQRHAPSGPDGRSTRSGCHLTDPRRPRRRQRVSPRTRPSARSSSSTAEVLGRPLARLDEGRARQAPEQPPSCFPGARSSAILTRAGVHRLGSWRRCSTARACGCSSASTSRGWSDHRPHARRDHRPRTGKRPEGPRDRPAGEAADTSLRAHLTASMLHERDSATSGAGRGRRRPARRARAQALPAASGAGRGSGCRSRRPRHHAATRRCGDAAATSPPRDGRPASVPIEAVRRAQASPSTRPAATRCATLVRERYPARSPATTSGRSRSRWATATSRPP